MFLYLGTACGLCIATVMVSFSLHWPARKSRVHHYTPLYDKESTQRTDSQKPACEVSLPTIFCSQQQPSCGIAPLATPRISRGLLKNLWEQTSCSHQCHARESPSEPIRGKVRQYKTSEWSRVPEGTEIFPSAGGSCSRGRPKTEKGNSVESRMTSPNVRDIAKADMAINGMNNQVLQFGSVSQASFTAVSIQSPPVMGRNKKAGTNLLPNSPLFPAFSYTSYSIHIL
uniref:Uncharacterized protein n=1 Tax=Nothoprocta perdicaria TaxID=30464 RepID=A0A8C7A2K3_NOTPE